MMSNPAASHGGVLPAGGGFFVRDPAVVDPGMPVDVPYVHLGEEWSARPIMASIVAAAGRHPDRIAVDDLAVQLTYRDLVRTVLGFATAIQAAAPVGAPIAAVLATNAAATPLLMAVMAAGRLASIVDAGWPAERTDAVFAALRPGLVVTSAQASIDPARLPAGVPTIALDNAAPGDAADLGEIDARAPMFVNFTSGSTGRPKGMVASHVGVHALVRDYVNGLHLNERDVIAALGPIGGIGMREVTTALAIGATVRIIDLRLGFEHVLRALHGVTILTFVPSVLRMLMGIPGADSALSSLRVLNTFGEPLLASDVALFRSKLPAGCRICTSFAATEVGMIATWFVRDEAITGATAPSGYLAPGFAILVADDHGNALPPGEPGELIVKGNTLGLTSWQDGKVVATRFTPDPHDPDQRIYATGDTIRVRPDGLIEVLGRRDRMVKIRGLQVDLGAVEAAMRTYPGIVDAVALPATRQQEPTRVVAAIVGPGIDAVQLRRHVERETAEHMAPVQVLRLDAIPRLANHKADLMVLERIANG